MVSFYCFWC